MTPIQQAIEALTDLYARGEAIGYSNTELSRIRSCITKVESLLPKEKEFVGKVWDDAAERISNIFTKTFPESAIADKQQFINQLYPQS